MAEISSEISRAEAAEASIAEELSTEVSYLIANTDLGSIDSFAEVVADLSSEVDRAESAEVYIKEVTNAALPSMYGFSQSPDGSNTTFTASVLRGTEIVFLNGLMLEKDNDYTVDTLTGSSDGGELAITFSYAPASTDKINIYGSMHDNGWFMPI
jgi:hypothetical protein